MVRPPCFDSNGMKKGAWSEEEDSKLRTRINEYGHRNWRLVPIFAGLARCGKSCRLRWVNYLKPGLKRGSFTIHEEDQIKILHDQLGNKWSAISEKMAGRTDNDVKNYWHAHIKNRKSSNKAMIRKRSSKSSYGITTDDDDHQEDYVVLPQGSSVENDEVIDHLNPIADPYTVDEKTQGDLCSGEYETWYGLFNEKWPLLTEADHLYDFGLCQEIMQNDKPPAFYDSSVSGMGSWHSADQESQVNLWSHLLEQNTFDILLW